MALPPWARPHQERNRLTPHTRAAPAISRSATPYRLPTRDTAESHNQRKSTHTTTDAKWGHFKPPRRASASRRAHTVRLIRLTTATRARTHGKGGMLRDADRRGTRDECGDGCWV